jgi:threonine synthase
MKYISTRGNAPILSFEEAMLTGLARDGGLYVPENIPNLSHTDIAAMAGKSYEEIAFQVMRPLCRGYIYRRRVCGHHRQGLCKLWSFGPCAYGPIG